MQYRWLLVLPFLAGALDVRGAELPPAQEPPSRLVRYYFSEPKQVEALFKSGADIPAHGKRHVDVMMPAASEMGKSDFAPLALATRGLKSETLLEDADEQARVFAAVPDLGVYHTLAEVKAELDATAADHPEIARVSAIGKTGEGRDIWAIRIGSTTKDGQKPAFLFTGAHHAREWISIEVPMAIVKKLTDDYATDAAVRALVDTREIWVVPVVNPDGVQHSQTNYKMWRKNRRPNGDGSFGVDPNRNYGYKWGGEGASPSPDSDTYRGPSAFSEPETQAIRDLSIAKKFVSAISFHSYSELVLWPWGYTSDPTRDAASFIRIGQGMAQFNGYTPEQSIELYPTTGDFDDYMYGGLGVLAFTIELGTQFVPPESEVAGIIASNLKASLWFLANAADPFPALMHESLQATTDVAGPYAIQATLRDPAAFPGATLELVYRKASASDEERTTMTAGAAGLYAGSIPGGALGEVAYHFELKSASGRQARLPAAGEFSFRVVDSLILVVADDNGGGFTGAYTSALDGLGRAYSVWDTKASGSPTVATLRGSSGVIWFTGETSNGTLRDTDQAALKEYLAQGGRLLLFGQDIGYEIKETAFYRDVLKAKYIADAASDTALSGGPGSFAAGMGITLGGGDASAQRYPEAIEALAGATNLFVYGNKKIGAIQTSSASGRIAYFGFGLEGVAGKDVRQGLLGRALEWAASGVAATVARSRSLEERAKAGDRAAGASLASESQEAHRRLQDAWDKGDASLAIRYGKVQPAGLPAALAPVKRDAGRLIRFSEMDRR